MIPPPIHADAVRLANPDRDPERDTSPGKAAGRAYSASKLCNLLTARALAASPDAISRGLRVIAYSPGPTARNGVGSRPRRRPQFRLAQPWSGVAVSYAASQQPQGCG